VTALVQAETDNDRLSEDELIAMLFLLLLAGHETTVNLIGNGTLALLEHPDQLQRLSDHPELTESAVEEVLRYHSPVEKFGPRIALEEVEVSGQCIPKGSGILLGLASANRDEAVFENPDQLDIGRTPNRHLAFGMGIHFCLGAPLARLEGKIAIQTLVQRYPHMQLAIPFEEVKWRKSTMLHGLHSLPLRLR
jgi:cytochrome P450